MVIFTTILFPVDLCRNFFHFIFEFPKSLLSYLFLFPKKDKNCLALNSFMTEVPIIQKPVHWFALQINGLVSIWQWPPSWKSSIILTQPSRWRCFIFLLENKSITMESRNKEVVSVISENSRELLRDLQNELKSI